MKLQDMRDALKRQDRADEAIFWFGYFWNSGPTSDLYRAMCETGYDPSLYQIRIKPGTEKFIETEPGKVERLTPANDPEILYCHAILMAQYKREHPENFNTQGVPYEFPLRRIRFDAIKEDDIVVHGPGRPFACIEADWPCRVFKHHGDLGVPCAEDPTARSFHPFKMDTDGFIVGFRR